jgi:hypothetical protein
VSQGVVTKHLFGLIAKQVDEHKLVVWYDPERAYEFVVAGFELPGTVVVRHDGSFFELRHQIDHLLNGEQPPRLLVYVPLAQDETDSALVELENMGVVMRPAQQPPSRNTKLSIVARNALKPIVGEETAAEVESQAELQKLTLADLNTLGEKGRDISTGLLSLIFGSANPQEVALAFLPSDAFDQEIEKKSARKDLVNLFQTAFDFDAPPAASLAEIRDNLARHILLTELLSHLGDTAPRSVSSVKVAETAVGKDACLRLARSWRNNRELRDSYVDAANRVEHQFSLDSATFNASTLAEVETFAAIERALIKHVEQSLIDSATTDLFELAQSRLSRFWAGVLPAVQARWALVATAAQVLLEADRIAGVLKKPPITVQALVEAYADSEQPWCLLDTYHRHLESRWFNFEPASGADHATLEKLIIKAEQRYTEVGSEMARRFVNQFAKTAQPIKGLLRQREVFESQVAPRLADGKLAYLWVDALRYEMAREFCRLLEADFEVSLRPAIGTPPTITEIGMAALLPGADESAKVVSVGGGKLALEIAGVTIKDRKDRVAFLAQHAGVPVFDLKLDDLLRKPLPKKIKDGIAAAELVLVTSQEIDELCERDNIPQARLQMDGVLSQLRRGVRVLGDLGIQSIVIAADHGHLFADEIGEDMKIEAPGGKAEDLHRRVWVGVGGTSEPSYLRMPLASLGVDSEFDIATPWNFACFKSKGGARAYFHGGLSPQELIIPVVVLTPLASAAASPAGIEWALKPGSATLTTRFFSVQVGGQQTSLFTPEPPKVRIEVRAGKKCISRPVSASYGFEDATGEVTLRASEQDPKRVEPNTVTLMIIEEIDQKAVDVCLLDAGTGAELASLSKIDVNISI